MIELRGGRRGRFMHYFAEFGRNWRPLIAGALGLGAGLALTNYSLSLFGPALLEEFGWSRSEFSRVGVLALITFFAVPVAGRLTDLFGPRRVAAFGAVFLPLTFVAFSMMRGDIVEFFAITIVQQLLCATTTSAVYTRFVAGRFERARGLALAIVMSGPASVAAIGTPFLGEIIDTQGWRAGYQMLALFSGSIGAIALLLAPGRPKRSADAAQNPAPRSANGDYGRIVRNPTFWMIFTGMVLCNVAQALPSSQLKLLLLDDGISSAAASLMISGYAIGVIVGRFISGVALDHLPAHFVAALGMGLPSIGLFILASSINAPTALGAAVLLLGLSQGAEGDLVGFLVMRYFGIDIYSTVLGLVVAGIAGAAALGAVVLSFTLAFSETYATFLLLSGMLVLAGAATFLLLGARPAAVSSAQAAV